MYLLEYNENGVLYKITPNAEYGLIGAYVNKLPMSIKQMLENDLIEEVTEDNIKKYKIKENE